MRNTEKAFNWIIHILERRKIAYKVSGGLAARVYGSSRELADIDIELAESDIYKIVEDVRPYIVFGPAQYTDDNWDLVLLTLVFEGQEIDIAGNEMKMFNQHTKQWEASQSDLYDVEIKEVFGSNVPIESLRSLIAYKSKLGRDVDIEDVRQLEKSKRYQ